MGARELLLNATDDLIGNLEKEITALQKQIEELKELKERHSDLDELQFLDALKEKADGEFDSLGKNRNVNVQIDEVKKLIYHPYILECEDLGDVNEYYSLKDMDGNYLKCPHDNWRGWSEFNLQFGGEGYDCVFGERINRELETNCDWQKVVYLRIRPEDLLEQKKQKEMTIEAGKRKSKNISGRIASAKSKTVSSEDNRKKQMELEK